MIRPSLLALCVAGPVAAQDITVVTDVPPVQAMVEAVLGSAPDVLVPMGASPHDFALAPSQARALSNADLVVWVDPTLTPWLEEPLETLASDAHGLELFDVPGWEVLEMRDTGHSHGHDDHDDHDDHEGHDDHKDHDDHDHDDHAKDEHDDHDHDEHDEHDHDEASHDDHDHDEHDDHDEAGHDGHHHEGGDPHAWLDPVVLAIWAGAVAEELSEIDPDNAATYAANADAYAASLDAVAALAPDLSGLEGVLLDHDGYQYLEVRYGFEPVAYVTDGHDAEPGPAHLAELRELVEAGEVTCMIHDLGAEPGWVGALSDGFDINTGAINPMMPIADILSALEAACVN